MIGYGGDGDAMLFGEIRVAWTIVLSQVVPLENPIPFPIFAGLAGAPQIVERQGEHFALPLAKKHIFGRRRGGSDFPLRGVEIKCHAASALEALRGFVLFHHKAVEAGAQISAEPSLFRVELRQDVLFDERRKESLHQDFGFFVGAIPLDAHVLVGGLPIDGDDGIERRAGGRALTGGRLDQGVAGGWKLMAMAADRGVGFVWHGGLKQ